MPIFNVIEIVKFLKADFSSFPVSFKPMMSQLHTKSFTSKLWQSGTSLLMIWETDSGRNILFVKVNTKCQQYIANNNYFRVSAVNEMSISNTMLINGNFEA